MKKSTRDKLLAALELVLFNYHDGYIAGHVRVMRQVRQAIKQAKQEKSPQT